ncbi:MAG: T9SS type A sorting domain-containing protein [Bacteroidota bacterium]
MKKILLLIIIGLLTEYSVHAQSLVIKDKTGLEVTGQTIDFLCNPADGFASLGLDTYNNSGTSKNVKVRRYNISVLDGTEISLCWLSCYPSFVWETPDPITIEPGTFSPNFTGDITYGALLGTTTSKFVFFDMDNQSDTSFVIVNFNIGYLGVPAAQSGLIKMVNAYPNPASSVVFFDYKLPVNSAKAGIRITNLLGTIIDELVLEKTEGKAILNVNNLKNGIYFYSLMINNSATITRKFVVKR